jgi:hypothetical protein
MPLGIVEIKEIIIDGQDENRTRVPFRGETLLAQNVTPCDRHNLVRTRLPLAGIECPII